MSGVFDLRFNDKVEAAVAEKKRKEAEFAELVSGLDPESIFFAERIWGIAEKMVKSEEKS